MRKNLRILNSVFGALFVIFAFSYFASAQSLPPSYGFLEVVDYKNQPVADASVYSLNGAVYTEPESAERSFVGKTNQKGLLENGIRFRYSDTELPFSIDKPGFYTFIDYFGLFGFLRSGGRDNRDKPVKIELLKVPETSAERAATGSEQQKREFFGAARGGNWAAVRQYIKSGLSPNLTTSDLRGVPTAGGVPVIIFAARSGSGATVKELLAAGANVRPKTDPPQNPLAVYLDAYPYQASYPATEAQKVAMLNAYETGAESLIDAGAELDFGVLYLAAGKGYARTLKKLLAKGAPINARDSAGRTTLLAAVESERKEIVDLLLERGANPNLLSGNYENSDNYCTSPLMSAVRRDNVNLIKLLLARQADPNVTCKNGQNALRDTLERGKSEIFEMLVKAGANVQAVDERGETNLMFAARKGDAAALKKMLDMGVPVNASSKEGATALIIAVGSGAMTTRLEKVKLLLEAGADPNIANQQKVFNSRGSLQYQRCETALIYVAENAEIDTLDNVPLSIFDLLVANNVNLNFTCENGYSALLAAIDGGQVKGVRKLLDAGVDVSGEKGKAALEHARKASQFDYNKTRLEEIIRMLEAAVVE